MKHKVGDKVRIKSREWYEKNKDINDEVKCNEAYFVLCMSVYCGKTATITSADSIYRIDLDKSDWEWTDEMFEDDEPQVSETLLKDIANVIKSHNMGVSVSEQEGKLIIEPLKVEEEDLPIDTPVMVADYEDGHCFQLRYYAGNGRVFNGGLNSCSAYGNSKYDIIIPWDNFNPNDIEESLKHNIVTK